MCLVTVRKLADHIGDTLQDWVHKLFTFLLPEFTQLTQPLQRRKDIFSSTVHITCM